ncbi:hypothetical protein AMTRI_Chr11g96940 [Amborella trichopoda]
MRAFSKVMISGVFCLLVMRTSPQSRMMWRFEDTLVKQMPSNHYVLGKEILQTVVAVYLQEQILIPKS